MSNKGEIATVLIVFSALVIAILISEKVDSKRDIKQHGQYAKR